MGSTGNSDLSALFANAARRGEAVEPINSLERDNVTEHDVLIGCRDSRSNYSILVQHTRIKEAPPGLWIMLYDGGGSAC